MPTFFCTKCDRQSESDAPRYGWRCPYCGGANRSRQSRAAIGDLCQQWKNLPAAEAGKLHRRTNPAVFLARVGAAEDFQAIASLALVEAACEYDPARGAFSTLAVLIIRQRLWQALNNKYQGFRFPLADVADHAAAEPIETATRSETIELVQKAIASLPIATRKVVISQMAGLKSDESAKALGMSQAWVNLHRCRARAILRDKLAPHFADDPA